MKIIYIANARIPTEKAHGIQIMKMCEAFSLAGNEVELILPKRLNHLKDDSFLYYDVKNNFKIKKLPCLDLVSFGRLGFYIQSLSFSIFAFFYSVFKRVDFVYSRDELPLYFLKLFKKKVVYEAHMPRYNFFTKSFKKIVVISEGLKDFYIKKGTLENMVLIANDAVDIDEFNVDISKNDARKKLDLLQNKKIILYTGHLYDWKGAQVLAESSRYFKNDEVFIFLGGTDKDIEDFKNMNKDKKNVIILGRVMHSEIPFYLKSADVLVLPNSAKSKISEKYTSPMKLFEYMASKKPIVASRLPSIEEVLKDNVNAVLVNPDNPKSLSEGIKKVLKDDVLSSKLSEAAFSDVRKYTWRVRAKNILNFVGL